MKQYKVPVTYMFTGYYIIEAESAREAKEIADKQCGARIGIGEKSNAEDWKFGVHPTDTKFGRVALIYSKGGNEEE